MGSYNISCAVSNIDIRSRDEVVVYLIGKHLEREGLNRSMFVTDYMKLISPFYLTGVYSDSGEIEYFDTPQNKAVLEIFGKRFGKTSEEMLVELGEYDPIEMTYLFCGRDEWKYECTPFVIRKEVHDYIGECFAIDRLKAHSFVEEVGFALQKEFTGEFAPPIHYLRYCDTHNKHSKKYERVAHVPDEESPWVHFGYSGGEGSAFSLKDDAEDFFKKLTLEPFECYRDLYFMLCQHFILERFMRAMNLVYKPNTYAGQSERFAIQTVVLSKFAEFAKIKADKKDADYKPWSDDAEKTWSDFVKKEYQFKL